MKRWIVMAALLGLVAVACGGDNGTTPRGGRGADTGPIKIGVVGPMTGLAAFVGKNMVEGVQLALDDINDAGGVMGRRVEFVTRDDEGDPSRTVTAVRELIERENVSALFGPAGESSYLAVARVLEEAQVPAWVIVSGPELTEDVHPYVFRGFIPNATQIEPLAAFAAQRYDRIAVLAGNDGEGDAFRRDTREFLRQYGKTPVLEEAVSPDETDYSPIALKVRQANADAIIGGSQIGVFAARFAVAAKNLGVTAQQFGPAGLINYTYPDLARDAADGTIFVSFRSWGHLPREEWPTATREFYERYVSTYLRDGEFSQTGAYRAYSTNFLTYDMVRIWARAAEEAGTADPKSIADHLNAGFTYPKEESVIAVEWEYSADDHDGIKPDDLVFYRWDLGDDGKFTLTNLGDVADVLAGRGGI